MSIDARPPLPLAGEGRVREQPPTRLDAGDEGCESTLLTMKMRNASATGFKR